MTAERMRALTVRPGTAGSTTLADVPAPTPAPGELLVEGLAVGVCGTDREIVAGWFGTPPPGKDALVLGHESLGRVLAAPPGADVLAGDLVVGVVRRPDPEPCGACAHGEFDSCRNGRYTERGIKELDGYASERWTVPAGYAVAVPASLGERGVLVEPASVVAKAWEQVERIGARSWYAPRRALVTGAGPIGLLAALLATQRGLEVHVLDVVADGPKPAAVAALGAVYHTDPVEKVVAGLAPDVVIESTGVPEVIVAAAAGLAPYGIACLTGVSPPGRLLPVDVGTGNRDLVLENNVLVGSVNANLRHYRAAVAALTACPADWLDRLITRRVPLDRYAEALDARPDDIKVVLTLS
ncbi:threonine dehydrogenase [Pilimelia anulata]|uniref:Threonine dehydrogenase n=1 Tax=Pilimelia anulata TaxID=53371 RepID=A0A8J3B8J4_9ACTN|nr:glucose 1-dehydrogenase [Pilimelia anulata]GGJ87277.1 threonine dehydrogenase [Pilimelia anulata]